jgi:predicted nuclease with TOPRIM domain
MKRIKKEVRDMREFLKDLRKNTNEELIEKLNYSQKNYNNFFDLRYKYNINEDRVNYNLDVYLTNMNKIKKVFKERNIKIEFINGWEIV